MEGLGRASLISLLVDEGLKKHDPVLKAERAEGRKVQKNDPPPAPHASQRQNFYKQKRYIPSRLRHLVWLRDNGVCTFKDSLSKKICHSRHKLQLDHIVRLPWVGSTVFQIFGCAAQHIILGMPYRFLGRLR